MLNHRVTIVSLTIPTLPITITDRVTLNKLTIIWGVADSDESATIKSLPGVIACTTSNVSSQNV